MHGYRGTAQSLGNMIDHLEAQGAGRQVMTITVSRDGQVTTHGRLNDQRNPLINVIFENNIAGEAKYTQWLRQVMRTLHRDYGVTSVNLVGHSMGAYAAIACGMTKSPVTIDHLVAIAGPYNGIMHWDDRPHEVTLNALGKPSQIRPEYQRLLNHRRTFQAGSVLNIYGDVNDGSASDTVVTVASARSLRYVLREYHGPYAEKAVVGSHAQHSLLHINNPVVNHAVAAFLWGQTPTQRDQLR
ncbi:putative cell surface hydrolase (putative) [Lacticaseibacillus camelliae DSM 22697 = JCM 13995]|uniref:Putative cell surface hydrolase (Putative) n=1 Tax=Lacticaseibacillus camelliae DSM 22697 = JCM 13995 TaxID=1423730 RepID=A0A0R2FJZ1_9LACO|nr:putative cell surface hydrolase (putative) [Lacticaseibacillus camelliae DSM 22697 = JCM 13995]